MEKPSSKSFFLRNLVDSLLTCIVDLDIYCNFDVRNRESEEYMKRAVILKR